MGRKRAISPPHSVFKRPLMQTRKNQGLFGKGLRYKKCVYASLLRRLVIDLHTNNQLNICKHLGNKNTMTYRYFPYQLILKIATKQYITHFPVSAIRGFKVFMSILGKAVKMPLATVFFFPLHNVFFPFRNRFKSLPNDKFWSLLNSTCFADNKCETGTNAG